VIYYLGKQRLGLLKTCLDSFEQMLGISKNKMLGISKNKTWTFEKMIEFLPR